MSIAFRNAFSFGSFAFAWRASDVGAIFSRIAFAALVVLLRPQRMVVAHRLAPVRHRERRIGFLRALERDGGFVELEAVEVLHAFDERGLRGGAPEFGKVIVPSSWELIGDAIATSAIDGQQMRRAIFIVLLLLLRRGAWAARGR